jgi:hydrogenase nickel incorporation protein HypA/HybF
LHELSIAEDMFRVIEKVLGRRRELAAVTLVLGPLSGVSGEALRFCFGEVASSRGFGRPELVIRKTKARIQCRGCGGEYEASDFYEGCPSCGSLDRNILSGRECMVESVEVEEEET